MPGRRRANRGILPEQVARSLAHGSGLHPGNPCHSWQGGCQLNDDFEGGRTWFPELDVRVEPRTGMVLLFRHLLPHAGETVLAGTKYVLRADLLYQAHAEGEFHGLD